MKQSPAELGAEIQAQIENGQWQRALMLCQQGLQAFPDSVPLFCLQAQIQENLGQPLQAAHAYQQVWELQPDLEIALSLASVWRQLGEYTAAENVLGEALAYWPEVPELYFNLGNLYRSQQNYSQAERAYQGALRNKTDYAAAHHNLAQCLVLQGKADAAQRQFQSLALLKTGEPLARIQGLGLMAAPVLLDHVEAGENWFQSALGRLQHLEPLTLENHLDALQGLRLQPPLWTRYYGCPELYARFRKAYAELFLPPSESLTAVPNRERPRLGIVVTRGHEASFIKTLGAALPSLSHEFELRIFCADPPRLAEVVDGNPVFLPASLQEMVITLQAAAQDILYFWEVGTDHLNYFLGFFRLAPIQLTSLGVPATSGVPGVDIFLSAQAAEHQGAQALYSERLVTLPHLPYAFDKPYFPLKSRQALGLDSQQHIYICTQTLNKIHPQMDTLFCELLAADPLGQIYLFSHPHSAAIDALFLQRLNQAMGVDLVARVHLLPRLPYLTYLQLLASADVILDSFPVCGGITTYDALAAGTPIVTLRGQSLSENITAAVLQEAGLGDGVQSERSAYLRQALALAQQPDFNRHWRARILGAQYKLFQPQRAGEHIASGLLRLLEFR